MINNTWLLLINHFLSMKLLIHYKVIFISHMLSTYFMFYDSLQMDMLHMHFKEMTHKQTSEYILMLNDFSRFLFLALTISYHIINLRISSVLFVSRAMFGTECARNFTLVSVLLRCTLDLLRQVRKHG